MFEGLAMEDVGVFMAIFSFFGQMIYCLAIWYILWSFGIYFPRFSILYREKTGSPVARSTKFGQQFIHRYNLAILIDWSNA
jgi:hypothetical protein